MHRATLKTGEEVVIKVQRKGIYETMARDIGLMHKAVRLMPPVSIKGMVDLNMVLSELWTVTQEEMNFLTEAANMAEFAKKNKDVAFVKVPILYREYISPHILVMEYIDGFAVNDKAALLANGYDQTGDGGWLFPCGSTSGKRADPGWKDCLDRYGNDGTAYRARSSADRRSY